MDLFQKSFMQIINVHAKIVDVQSCVDVQSPKDVMNHVHAMNFVWLVNYIKMFVDVRKDCAIVIDVVAKPHHTCTNLCSCEGSTCSYTISKKYWNN